MPESPSGTDSPSSMEFGFRFAVERAHAAEFVRASSLIAVYKFFVLYDM